MPDQEPSSSISIRLLGENNETLFYSAHVLTPVVDFPAEEALFQLSESKVYLPSQSVYLPRH